jgi:hypothetical protein
MNDWVKEWVRYTRGVIHRPNMARQTLKLYAKGAEITNRVEDRLGEVGPGSSPITSYLGRVGGRGE